MNARSFLLFAAAVGLAAGCSSSSASTTSLVLDALDPPPATDAPATTAAAPAPPGCGDAWEPTQSFTPLPQPLPEPGAMPAGSTMAAIAERGYVVIGVDENTVPLSYRIPRTTDFAGFEIDLAHLVAAAILGDPTAVQFRTVTTSQKLSTVADGTVDISISANSMNCGRWGQVLFSQPYYEAVQRVMVRSGSGITTRTDLEGRVGCVTRGSSSSAILKELGVTVTELPLETRTDCLLALQEGRADFVLTHDTFLFGFAQLDQALEVLPDVASRPSSYGIAVSHESPDLARFLNGVLEELRTDGSLDGLAKKWFTPPSGVTVPAGLDGVLRTIPVPEYREP